MYDLCDSGCLWWALIGRGSVNDNFNELNKKFLGNLYMHFPSELYNSFVLTE